MSVAADFREFDRGGQALSRRIRLQRLRPAPRRPGHGLVLRPQGGRFGGFVQGTPEYDRLLSQYLRQVESHLAANGWLGKEYIYWFDEPDPKDYPFVREGMLNIRKNAPKLTRFITEHRPGPEIMDVSEIGCTIFDRVDPKAVAELAPKGREFWSYLCTGPQEPVGHAVHRPSGRQPADVALDDLRLGAEGRPGLAGQLLEQRHALPGRRSSRTRGPIRCPTRSATASRSASRTLGQRRRPVPLSARTATRTRTRRNISAGPVDSVRWEILREGIEDYEYFVLLEKAAAAGAAAAALAAEARALLKFPATLFASGKEYAKDPKALLDYRAKVADLIEKFGSN